MNKEQAKHRANLIYRLRQKGIRCRTRQYTIYYPYGEDPTMVPEICSLREEFHFVVQFEIV